MVITAAAAAVAVAVVVVSIRNDSPKVTNPTKSPLILLTIGVSYLHNFFSGVSEVEVWNSYPSFDPIKDS